MLQSEGGEEDFLVRESQGSSKVMRVETQKEAWLGTSELKRGGSSV